MRSLNPKAHSILYAALIEGVVLLFSTRINGGGPCGSFDEFSGFMILFTAIFHIPGFIAGVLVYFPLRYILPSPWHGSAFVAAAIAGNFLFLSWLIYTIRKMRSPSYS